jgi:type I restriction enzyme S subunit
MAEMTPKVRFAGFSEEWQSAKLNAHLDTSYDINLDGVYTKEDVLSVSGDYGIVNQIEFQGRSFAGASVTNYGKVETGDVVYTKSPLKSNPYGIIKANKGKPGIVSTLYAVYHPKENTDSNFVQCYFESDYRLNRYLARLVNKGAKNDMKVSNDNALLGIVVFPKRDEQIKISVFLAQLDCSINVVKQKYEKLLYIKKFMLEKMFPRDGSDMPEIRFKGFTGAWEKHKVGDILVERNEKAPKSEEYPLMAFIANEGIVSKGERYDRSSLINDTENKLYKKTQYGDFIYSSNNLETGSIGLNNYGKASISPVYSIFQPTGLAVSDFIGRRLVRKDFINQMVKWRQGVMYGQWRIHESDFKKLDVFIPSIEEQKEIGSFLKNLDNIITPHHKELEKLKNLKKALLEKMFV